MGERAYQAAEKIRAEKWLVAEASWTLTGPAALDDFDGQLRAHAVTSLLDTMLLHWHDVPEPVRKDTLKACREISGRLKTPPERRITKQHGV